MALPLGAAPSILLGAGLGGAASVAFTPAFEPARQKSWSENQFRILEPALYAALVAQGAIDLSEGQNLAHNAGYNNSRFDSLVYLAQRAPTHSEAQDMRRRGRITADQLRHTFAKEQIEEQYWDALEQLVDDRLSAQAVALGIIRSVLKDPGFFPVNLDTSGGVVPAYPVSPIDPIEEAKTSGFDEERLRVMVASIGRPPGPGELARAYFRGLIKRGDFNRGMLEGDTRPEWADPFLDVNREILTAGQYAELQLRGYLSPAERLAKTDQHGMSAGDSELLYDLLGRSIPVHQITTGEARGGTFDGPVDTIPKAYLQSLQRGNLRPEYYNLAYANRYSYPSAFVFRALLTDGVLTQQQGEQYFRDIGWPPALAKEVSTAYASAGAGGGTKQETAANLRAEFEGYFITEQEYAAALAHLGYDPATVAKLVTLGDAARVKKARDQVMDAAHKSYVAGTLTNDRAQQALADLHIVPEAIGDIVALWDLEKSLTLKTLTPAQIRAAYRKGNVTEADAISELEAHGYSTADATTYLTS